MSVAVLQAQDLRFAWPDAAGPCIDIERFEVHAGEAVFLHGSSGCGNVGACIHTPPPPANQILHVRPKTPAKFRAMDTVWVTGRLVTRRNDSMMGTSGYTMTADSVTKYSSAAK